MISKVSFNWFRKIAIAEGISFLVLLFIAMPLKYFAGLPIVVTIVGSLHGVLFIAFMALAMYVRSALNKKPGWLVVCFIAAILPFGTFVLDRSLRKEEGIG